MDRISVSDADVLNILQGINKAEVTTENTSHEIGNEVTPDKQNNKDSNFMSQNKSKETGKKDNSTENPELEIIDKPEEFETLSENANASETNEDINKNIDHVDELFTFEDLTNKINAKSSVTPDDLGDTSNISASKEDFMENSFTNVSLYANEAELDMFTDCNTDEGKMNNQIDKAEVRGTESIQSRMKREKKIQKSHLHCAICNNYFEKPKLLECLHTFCQSCLMKGMKSNYKYIFCVICSRRSSIPKGGIEKLADNVVAASLVYCKLGKKLPECMICQLHNEVNIGTGQCLDCGDIMCQDCSRNHTFSRLTAKHVVVTLEQAKSWKYGQTLQKESITCCMTHSDEISEYFCMVCSVPVCKECKESDHRSHKCDFLKDAVAGKREVLKHKLDTFRLECAKHLVDDTDQSRSLIYEHKEGELEKLEGAKDALIAIIDEKYSKCLKQLQEEYDIKTRKYCKHKKIFLKNLGTDISNTEESILFLLSEGNDFKLAMLENIILMALKDKRLQLGKLHPKLTEQSSFPEVKIFKEHAEIVEAMTFFCSNQKYVEEKRKDRSEKRAHSENGDIRMKTGRKFKN